MCALCSAALSHGLVPSDAAAGIGKKTVVLTAAAVLVPAGDHNLLQRLETEEASALHHIVVNAKAVEKLGKVKKYGLKIINLGTGNGYSVLQIVKAFEKASGRKVPYVIKPRRSGDVAECWADPSFAKAELGWKAQRGIEKMCEDLWRWQSMNPYGFKKVER